MKTIMAIFLLLVSTLSLADTPGPKGWRGIVPLHSTRADVERLLGPGTNDCKCAYYLADVNVFFKYSPGDCKSGRGAWDVPPDTVLWITVVPKPMPRLSDLVIDANKFKKRQKGHIEGQVYYENDEEGLSLEVYEGIVQGFLYGPTAYDQHLRCSDRLFFTEDLSEKLQARLLERLNQFIEYSRSKQYENQYELFLPEFAAKVFPVKNKEEFANWIRNQGPISENWIEFKPRSITAMKDETYGKVYYISGLAKALEAGKIVESYRYTRAVLRDGDWYLIDLFQLGPG